MVEISKTAIHKRNQDLLNQAGQRQSDFLGLSGEQCVPKVFLMQANAKPRLEIASDHHGGLRVQNSTSGEPALDRVEDHLRINSTSIGKNERFRHGGYIACHHDLIRQFGYVASSHSAGENHA